MGKNQAQSPHKGKTNGDKEYLQRNYIK